MKIENWKFISIVILLFSALLFSSTHAAESQPIELVYTTMFAAMDKQGQLCETWAREIEKRTQGKVKINFFPDGTILKGDEICRGLLLGATDIGMSAFGYDSDLFPAMEAIDLSIGYSSAKMATAVINSFYGQFHPQEFADFKVLYLHAHGPGLLHSKKAVHKLEDLKGMRIRGTGFGAEITRALGACPVIEPQGYTRVMLQDNYVDATWSPMEVLKGWRQAEVIKYTIEPYCIGYTTGFYALMSRKKWDALPEDIQRIIDEVSAKWIVKHAQAWDAGDEEARKFTLSLGNKIIALSPTESERWCQKVQPVIEAYVKRVEDRGLPGTEYFTTIRELIQKYKYGRQPKQ
jgi:TRAP-type C4-dicarboxylate transport system substrate-binding protein